MQSQTIKKLFYSKNSMLTIALSYYTIIVYMGTFVMYLKKVDNENLSNKEYNDYLMARTLGLQMVTSKEIEAFVLGTFVSLSKSGNAKALNEYLDLFRGAFDIFEVYEKEINNLSKDKINDGVGFCGFLVKAKDEQKFKNIVELCDSYNKKESKNCELQM